MVNLDLNGYVYQARDIEKEIHVPSSDGLDHGRLFLRGNVIEWRIGHGYLLERTFHFSTKVLDFALVEFDQDVCGWSLCVLVRTDRITIVRSSGTCLDVQLLFHARAIFGMNNFLLIEKSMTRRSTDIRTHFYYLKHPLEDIKPLYEIEKNASPTDVPIDAGSTGIVVFANKSPSIYVTFRSQFQTYQIKAIGTKIHEDKLGKNDIDLESQQIWESVPAVLSNKCDFFMVHGLCLEMLLCLMDHTRKQLMLLPLEILPDGRIQVQHSSPISIVPCELACAVSRSYQSNQNDMILLTLQGTWEYYRGPQSIATLTIPTIPDPIAVKRLLSTPLPHIIEVELSTSQTQQLALPFKFTNPLLNHIFGVLEGVLPIVVALKWKFAVLPLGWRGFQSTLVSSFNATPSSKTAYERLMTSQLGLQLQQSNPKLFEPLASPNVNNMVNSFDQNLLSQIKENFELIFSTLHLVYENLKVSMASVSWLRSLGSLLARIASTLGLNDYLQHYTTDFGLERLDIEPISSKLDSQRMAPSQLLTNPPHNLMEWLQQTMTTYHYNCIQGKKLHFTTFPVSKLLPQTKYVVELYSYLYPSSGFAPFEERAQNLVRHLVEIPNFASFVEDLPDGVALPLLYALTFCKHEPHPDWDSLACQVIHRPDWVGTGTNKNPPVAEYNQEHPTPLSDSMNDDGYDDVISSSSALFPQDHRMSEVLRLIRSNKPMYLKVHRGISMSDADIVNAQQAKLLLLCKRSMAMSVARGMVTFGSMCRHPPAAFTTPLKIPPIVLSGRIAETNAQSILDTSGYKELTLWPQFHNGVATGLRLPSAKDQDLSAQWILSHKPRDYEKEDEIAAHAGFILGLGLLGHLHHFTQSSIYQYLSIDNEITTVGMLLGLATSTIHQRDLAFVRMVSRILTLHIPILLPATFSHVNISPSAQTVAIMGLGIVYHGTGNRSMIEILLTEISAAPIIMSPTSSQSTVDLSQKEGYSLAAGLALGLIVLGRKSDSSVADLHLEEKLKKYMTGGTQRSRLDPANCVLRTKKKSDHYDWINVDVTAPGSALALGLMYIQSDSIRISQQLRIPTTIAMLETIRPDILFARVVATNLVAWSAIEPNQEWIDSQIPVCLCSAHLEQSTVQEGYSNVLAAACFSLGLRFAGTHDKDAKSTLMQCMTNYIEWRSQCNPKELSRTTWERCFSVLAQSVAMVMAGSGDIETMKLLRSILLRQKHDTIQDVTYGTHIAMSSALGLLFLGGGRCSLNTIPFSIAMLVIAFYPLYPSKTTDQKYHLQAFRHLYVLSIDTKRLVETIDSDTGELSPIHLKLWRSDTVDTIHAPCLLPPFAKLSIDSSHHFPLTIDLNDHTTISNQARAKTLKHLGRIYIKRKQGDLDSPQMTLLQKFHRWFVQGDTSTRWGAFCARVWQECELQHKPNMLSVYLNAKYCEDAVLTQSLPHTLLVSNLQLIHLHMELEAHIYQYEEHTGEDGVAQLINEDFILGYNNSLLLHFSLLEDSSDTSNIDNSAHRRYVVPLDSPHLEQ